jgi:hypothetical protein
MNPNSSKGSRSAALFSLALVCLGAAAQGTGMSFFVTSTGSGNGADLGGLAGADKHCQTLAKAAGAGSRTWRAYLSAGAAGSTAAVNARDRIGNGPWRNAKGEVIAKDIVQLHGENNLNKQTALTEKGEVVPGRGDWPAKHDILTGSTPDGRALDGGEDTTCGNWTNGGSGGAMVGHHDRAGASRSTKSWNSSHRTHGGCSQEALRQDLGDGLFYCFAVD